MIHSITGTLRAAANGVAVIETGGVGYRIHVNNRTAGKLSLDDEASTLFTHLHTHETGIDLYGFVVPAELALFELLLTVSGVGPRSALSVLDLGELHDLTSAIYEGRSDLLARAVGVGRKTAERIIVELKDKVAAHASTERVARMEEDADLIETLISLGYRRDEARAALKTVPVGEGATLGDRLKTALKALGKRP